MKRLSLALACALFAAAACEDAGPPTSPDSGPAPQFAIESNTLTGEALAHGTWVPNSTNELNKAKLVPGRVGQVAPYVSFKSAGVGEVTLEFHNLAAGLAFFEVRINGVPTGSTAHPIVTGSTIHSGGQSVTASTSPVERTFSAATTVDIRLALGGERDWDFDWTRFYVLQGYALTLTDEAGSPLPNQAGVFKYRCGGSWAPSVSFTTDVNGKFSLEQPACANWDKKVTVTVNQTSKEQDVTVNPVFQTAKVKANLKSCTAPITATPGGTVDQGGGYWFAHGTTGPSGTRSFYTFPGGIKLRMSYNHHSMTLYPTIVAGTNEVNFQTTRVNMTFGGIIKSNMGGSWWNFAQPGMDLLPGTYNFWFNGSGPQALVVTGCEMVLLRVVDENGNGVAGAKATPASGGTWNTTLPGATNASGYLFGVLPSTYTKVLMEVNGTGQQKSSAQMALDNNTWTTEILRILLTDHAGAPITTGATLAIGLSGWPSLGSLGTYRDIPLFSNQNFRVTYNFTTEQKSGVVVPGPGIETLTFQTGQVAGLCSNYDGGGWKTFVSGMQLMPGTRNFRYPQAPFTVVAGTVNNVPCTN